MSKKPRAIVVMCRHLDNMNFNTACANVQYFLRVFTDCAVYGVTRTLMVKSCRALALSASFP